MTNRVLVDSGSASHLCLGELNSPAINSLSAIGLHRRGYYFGVVYRECRANRTVTAIRYAWPRSIQIWILTCVLQNLWYNYR